MLFFFKLSRCLAVENTVITFICSKVTAHMRCGVRKNPKKRQKKIEEYNTSLSGFGLEKLIKSGKLEDLLF